MKKQLMVASAFLLFVVGLSAQPVNEQQTLSVQSQTLVSSGHDVPFWLQMNQLGINDGTDQFQQLFVLNWNGMPVVPLKDKLQLSYGAVVLGRVSDHSAYRFNEYWVRLHFKKWYIHAGAKSEPVFANGLSLTNGNMFLSNNARPMPRIGFGMQNFQLSQKGWLSRLVFDFQYNEYILLDDRFVSGAHLHHKRLGAHYSIAPKWSFSAGIDHWVWWGGTVPAHNQNESFKMPGWSEYIRYVLGKSGSSSATASDQANVSGNQLGQFAFSLVREDNHILVNLYYQHPWEDLSGIHFANSPDGLWGLSLKFKRKRPLLQSLVAEYLNTRDQSGQHNNYAPDPVSRPDYRFGQGKDNYFIHGEYQSGFTSYGRMIGVPVFVPTIDENGISKGFANTRIWAFQEGMGGWLSNSFNWKTMFTYSRHFGNWGALYQTPRQLLSLGAQIAYDNGSSPLQCAIQFAYDHGALLDSSFGAELKLTYKIR